MSEGTRRRSMAAIRRRQRRLQSGRISSSGIGSSDPQRTSAEPSGDDGPGWLYRLLLAGGRVLRVPMTPEAHMETEILVPSAVHNDAQNAAPIRRRFRWSMTGLRIAAVLAAILVLGPSLLDRIDALSSPSATTLPNTGD